MNEETSSNLKGNNSRNLISPTHSIKGNKRNSKK